MRRNNSKRVDVHWHIVDIHEHDHAINRQGPSDLGFKYLGWKFVPDILVRC